MRNINKAPKKGIRFLPRLLALCESQDTALGWTVIDFGNARLASAIYEQNF